MTSKEMTSKRRTGGGTRTSPSLPSQAPSLMERILGGQRTSVIADRQRSFVGQTADNMPPSAFVGYEVDPITGEVIEWTWGELQGWMRDNGIDPGDMTYEEFWREGLAKQLGLLTEIPEGFELPTTSRGGGGGRASGATGPVYRAPDRATIEDQIKPYVIATTGSINQHIIDAAVSEYMSKDLANFNSEEQAIDAWQAAKAVVQGTAEYKSLQNLRPDFVEDVDWVASRQGKLMQLGLSGDRAQELGIEAAKVGASDEALVDQASQAQIAGTGRLLAAQRQGLQRSAAAALRLV